MVMTVAINRPLKGIIYINKSPFRNFLMKKKSLFSIYFGSKTLFLVLFDDGFVANKK